MFSDRIDQTIKRHGYRNDLVRWNFNEVDFSNISEDDEQQVLCYTIDNITENLNKRMIEEYSISLHELPSNVSAALSDMAFRLGVSETMKVGYMMSALSRENFLEAAAEALNATQGLVDTRINVSYALEISGNRLDLVFEKMKEKDPQENLEGLSYG